MSKFNVQKCLNCGSKNLVEMDNNFILAEKESIESNSKDYVEVTAIKCEDCGFIHLFTD